MKNLNYFIAKLEVLETEMRESNNQKIKFQRFRVENMLQDLYYAQRQEQKVNS